MKKLFVFLFGIFEAGTVSAAKPYKPLETFPGLPAKEEGIVLGEYLSALYIFAIWAVGLSAFVMIVVGGFWYISSAGNQSQASNAKRIVKDALLGLFVALFAWLILNEINPDLVNIKIQGL